jgi:nitroimidazol reductase NimA-like FMN-containing flavoprotein (pyridoxamine 5'-phosphate oxidase superfamily)
MFGEMNSAQIEEVLHLQVVGRIGCHANGVTYVVPISYAYDGKYLYGHTDEGMKVDIMRKNPDVCFQVDVMPNMANWKSVIAWGKYEELTEGLERNKAIEILLHRTLPHISSKTVQFSPHWPFPPTDPGLIKGIVYRILVGKKSGRFENMDTSSGFAS